MTDYALIAAWGAWFARFHSVARKIRREQPALYAAVRHWKTIHDHLLAEQPVDPMDATLEQQDPSGDHCFGILHGDLNASNFFITEQQQPMTPITLHVFDWDQLQLGWFAYDLALPIFGCTMLAGAGEFPSGAAIADVDPERFTSALVEGYESVAGQGAVDRAHLQRMTDIRRDFYEKFCRRSLERCDLPEGMMTDFVKFVVAWFDREKKTQ
jgi:Ser/Thr protein kinase RdoA (MazF antagonist)